MVDARARMVEINGEWQVGIMTFGIPNLPVDRAQALRDLTLALGLLNAPFAVTLASASATNIYEHGFTPIAFYNTVVDGAIGFGAGRLVKNVRIRGVGPKVRIVLEEVAGGGMGRIHGAAMGWVFNQFNRGPQGTWGGWCGSCCCFR